jgi:hypothetical protein
MTTIKLANLLDLVGLEALRANLDLLHAAVDLGLHGKKIGLPGPAGPVFGMANVIAEFSVFTANITFPRHDLPPYDRVQAPVLYQKPLNLVNAAFGP